MDAQKNAGLPDDAVEWGMVYSTKDYDAFKFDDGNRNINPAKVKNIVRSFHEEQLPVPIVVDKAMTVLDGQHRLQAARTSGFRAYFIKLKKDVDPTQVIRLLNTNQSQYTLPDFLKLYVNDGRTEYMSFQNLYEYYDNELDKVGVTEKRGEKKIVFTSMLGLLCGREGVEKQAFLRHATNPWNQGSVEHSKLSTEFRNGKMSLSDTLDGVTTLSYLIELLSALPRQRQQGKMHRNAYSHLKNREYLAALHYLLNYRNEHANNDNEMFDEVVLLQQAKLYPKMLLKPDDTKIKEWTDALRQIQSLYNWNTHDLQNYTYLASL